MNIEVDYNPTPAKSFFVSVGLNDDEALSFDCTTKGCRVIKQVLVKQKSGVQNLDKKEISEGWDIIELKDGRFVKKYHVGWIDKGKIDEVNNEVWETVWSKVISDVMKDKLFYWSQFISDNYERLDNFNDQMLEFESYMQSLVDEFIK